MKRNNNLKYQQIIPKNEHLKKFIKLYYLHRSKDENFKNKITYFPNYVTTINIYKNSEVLWDELSRTHNSKQDGRFQILLVSKFDKSREIIMNGIFDKLTIVFNPLGLNHFLKEPLSNYTKDNFSFFHEFGEVFNKLLEQIFSLDNIEEKRDLLDEFFLGKFIGFEEHRLSVAVNEILKTSGQISIQQIAQDLNISRKTLLRLFKKHLSHSPSEYKSIVKFRTALNNYQNSIAKPKLSALAYESYYYDQSDLNFHFKCRTGLTPQQLFSRIQTIEKGLYWEIEHVPKVQDIE